MDFAEIDEIEQTFISNSNTDQLSNVKHSPFTSSSSVSRSPSVVSNQSKFPPKNELNVNKNEIMPKSIISKPNNPTKSQININNYFSKNPIMPVFYPHPSQPPAPIGKHEIDIESSKTYMYY